MIILLDVNGSMHIITLKSLVCLLVNHEHEISTIHFWGDSEMDLSSSQR
jgi:hypothetical protein